MNPKNTTPRHQRRPKIGDFRTIIRGAKRIVTCCLFGSYGKIVVFKIPLIPGHKKGSCQLTAHSKDTTDSVKAANSTKDVGVRGEKLAVKYLRKQGAKLLARNSRCPAGEGDIIILDKTAGEIAIVEVKTRTEGQQTNPESAVNSEKQKRLRKIGQYYLDTHETGELGMRFDVVSITIPAAPDKKPEIRHIPNAF